MFWRDIQCIVPHSKLEFIAQKYKIIVFRTVKDIATDHSSLIQVIMATDHRSPLQTIIVTEYRSHLQTIIKVMGRRQAYHHHLEMDRHRMDTDHRRKDRDIVLIILQMDMDLRK